MGQVSANLDQKRDDDNRAFLQGSQGFVSHGQVGVTCANVKIVWAARILVDLMTHVSWLEIVEFLLFGVGPSKKIC